MFQCVIRGFLAALFPSVPILGAQAYPVTVKSCGRAVTFDHAPRHAVSFDINMTEMMLALGLEAHMAGYAGITGWNKLTPELQTRLKGIPQLAEKYPSREVLLAANTDFYFAGWNYGMKVGGDVTPDTLVPFGIQVYELTESCIHIMEKPPVSMEDMYTDLRALGAIFHVEDQAERLIAGYRARLGQIGEKIAPKDAADLRVFVYDSGNPPFTAAKYAMPTAMIEAAGGHNILDEVNGSWTEVDWEELVARNPQVIVIIDYGKISAEQKIDFLKRVPALTGVDAIRDNRFVVLDYDEATPGPRNIEAIAKLARAFHPEAF